jgi:hypothetical protein
MEPPPLDNKTEFVAEPRILLDKEGEKVVTIVKATFELEAGAVELAPKERMRKLRSADVPWGDPKKSSILFPSDLCVRKPGTDVVVVARGYAPGGRAVTSFDVAVKVGHLQKIVRVFGLRVWQAGGSGLSAPRPITEIDIRYDFAWGGLDDSDPASIVEEARNPVGLGIARDGNALTHQAAPSLEDPLEPIATSRTRPPPAGIGAIGRSWEPRRKFHGTLDAKWLDNRAPLPPLDMDDRANLCATPELCATPPLQGGESVALLNLSPGGGTVSFDLPKIGVEVEYRVKGREPEVIRPYLDTVLLDFFPRGGGRPPAIELVWRAASSPPRNPKDAKIIVREVAP